MEESVHQNNIDNVKDLIDEYNDNDLVGGGDETKENYKRKKVLKEISDYKLTQIQDYLFGNNTTISDCSAFINPALKQIERFMYCWICDLTDESRKSIVTDQLGLKENERIPYSKYTKSPLWRDQSTVFKMVAGYECGCCGQKFNPAHLVVHHITYEHLGSEFNHLGDLSVLCTDCHLRLHGIRRKDDNR